MADERTSSGTADPRPGLVVSRSQRILQRIVEAVDAERLSAHGVQVDVGSGSAEYRWRPDVPSNVFSVSKGVAVLAAGIAVAEGALDPDTRVGEVMPSLARGPGAAEITLLHLLTMTSGIDFAWFADQPVPGGDLAAEMLRRSARGMGEVFQYSDASTYVAMRMVDARVGDVHDWLCARLFEPLGIRNAEWERCPLGFVLGGSGLTLRTSELAAIGRLLRDGGGGIVSPSWVASMHGTWRATGADAPWSRYGMGCWAGPEEGWRLDGLHGQYVYVSTRSDAVVTITADERERDHRLVEIAALALADR